MNVNVSAVMEAACGAMETAGVDVLLIGGFAVNHYGYSRSTLDIDFMAAADEVERLIPAMQRSGFTNVEHQDNVVFFQMPGHPVRTDVLKVDARTMNELLTRAVTITWGAQSIRLPALPDLLAMKLFSLKQGGDRRVHKDLPDIANLAMLHQIDATTLKDLCMRYADEGVHEQVVKEINLLRQP